MFKSLLLLAFFLVGQNVSQNKALLSTKAPPSTIMVQEEYPKLTLKRRNRVFEFNDLVITYKVYFLDSRARPIYYRAKSFSERGITAEEMSALRGFARKESRKVARELKNEMLDEFFDKYLSRQEYRNDKLECSRRDDTNTPLASLLHRHIFTGNLDLRLNCEYRTEAVSGFGTMVTSDNICFVFSKPPHRADVISTTCEVRLARRGSTYGTRLFEVKVT